MLRAGGKAIGAITRAKPGGLGIPKHMLTVEWDPLIIYVKSTDGGRDRELVSWSDHAGYVIKDEEMKKLDPTMGASKFTQACNQD